MTTDSGRGRGYPCANPPLVLERTAAAAGPTERALAKRRKVMPWKWGVCPRCGRQRNRSGRHRTGLAECSKGGRA